MMSDTSTLPPVTAFDPIDPLVMECPYPHYREAQDSSPVHRVPGAPYYLVTRFADVQDVLRRHADFSSDLTPLFDGMGPGCPFVPEPVLNFSDPPIHSRSKPIAIRAFGPARVRALEAKIHQVVDDLIDRFIVDGEVELVEQFALPLPMTIIAGELGVPSQDIGAFKYWSDQMLMFNKPGASAETVATASQALGEANHYFREKFLARRASPENDLISILATATTEIELDNAGSGERPRPLSDNEALSMIQLILVGGNETTTNAIVNGMLLLLQNPSIVAGLRDGSADLKAVIEETLRLESPVRGFWRLAARDTWISGVSVPKGTMVFLSFAAANRDPARFDAPDRLDPARPNLKDHVAFGHGVHMCIGLRLARAEMEIAFGRLFARLANIRLTPGRNDMDNLFIPTALVRGLQSLHLSFDRA